ncbi:glycosyltransferase [Lacinutrix sp. WUR7]|uniref:ATP-grasp fold amidoligase family protein n=1 Tax=Lacinutrix sp. WUR7 TaxID=2653681 RepID=UPI00193D31A6|nr:ATP-grasp fold amidoligase family protein [Lacinutrix sp. WUR7]QRM89681.1 glycosyltransferase [Lacinutrix sp. WUR7]
MRFLPPPIFAKFYYEYHTGKKLNLNKPIEFNEKIQWYKVFYHPKILNQLVDKYAVRKYVEEKIGNKYLNEVYGVFEKAEDINYKNLPNKFVIKATHASSYNLIVTNKNDLNLIKTTKLFNKWLCKNQYYRMGQEWAYKDVQPRLIIEKILKEEGKSSLTDYKFYCFNGVAKFADVHLDREENHQQGCYDLNFNLLPFRKKSKNKNISTEIKKPSNYDEMIKLSETLAANFPFVRVDFYSINGNAIFGEMTFYPSDGRKDFFPDEYNTIIGDYFKLPTLEKGQKVITKIN